MAVEAAPPLPDGTSPETASAPPAAPTRPRTHRAGPESGALAPFRYRDFRILWAALVTRAAARWMDQVARPVLVFELTGSGFLVGAVIAARMAPNILLGLFAGSLVDRYPRRGVLVVSQLVNGLSTLALVPLLLTDAIEAWHVIALVSLQGVNISFFQPARQAILPALVPPAALRGAVAMSQTAQHSMRILGGILGGVLLAVTSFAVVYGIMAILYGVAVALLLAIRADTRPARRAGAAVTSIWQSTLEGARWAIRTRRPLGVALLGALLFGIVLPYQSVFVPILVIEDLGKDRSFVGYLASATGVGAVLASFTVASLRQLPSHGAVMLGLLMLSGGLLLALSAAPGLALIAVILAAIGGSNVAFMSVNNLTMLSLAPDDMTGRAMSLMNFARGLIPVGGLVAGVLADEVGARNGILVMGCAALAAAAVVVLLMPSIRRI